MFYSVTEDQYLESVRQEKQHHPLVTFLCEEPDNTLFEKEMRDFPVLSAYSSLKVAKQRGDMQERSIDCVECSRHSFLRCLSKEIFGNEKNVDILMKEISNELSQNLPYYIPFIGEDMIETFSKVTSGKMEENQKCFEKLAKYLIERIEDDLPSNDLLLWLACTFLQTPIYVLRVVDTNTSTESFWTEYTKLRKRKRDPLRKTSFTSKCPQNNTYYVTLLDTGYGQYHRIVPKLKVCNCALEPPRVPNYQDDATRYHIQQGLSSVI